MDTGQGLYFHLKELRLRLLLCVVPVLLAAPVFYLYSDDALSWVLTRVGDASAPYIVYGLADAFMLKVKFAVLAAFAALSPWVLFQTTLFVLPALYPKEKLFYFFITAVACGCVAASAYVCQDFLAEWLIGLLRGLSPPHSVTGYSAVRFFGFIFNCVIAAAVTVTVSIVLLVSVIFKLSVRRR
jgi:Sec-independent protein secretion pathway component TatC